MPIGPSTHLEAPWRFQGGLHGGLTGSQWWNGGKNQKYCVFLFFLEQLNFGTVELFYFFYLKMKSQKKIWNEPVELAKPPQILVSQRMVKTSNIRASAQVATTHHASELWLATQCGDPRGSPATETGCFLGIRWRIFVKHGEHLWTSVACPSSDLQFFKCKIYVFLLIPQMYLEVQLAICNKHLKHSTRGIAKDNWRSKFRTPNQNQSKISKGFRFGLFYHQWMKVLTCVSHKLRE